MEYMEYQVILKAPYDMTEEDYAKGNTLSEERFNGIRYGLWFDTLEEAIDKCIKHNAYGIIDSETFEYVWENPNYKSKSFEKLRKQLGKILLPH